jgi:hypothetical protein
MNASWETSSGISEMPHRASRTAVIFIIVVLTLSVALNVVLAHKVRSLTHAQSARIADRLLKVGTTVPPITAKRLDGEQDAISYQSTNEATVLYVFTPSCVWCARNLDNLKTLLGQESSQYRFIGVSLSEQSLAEYVTKNEMKLPVYSGLSPDTLKTYSKPL